MPTSDEPLSVADENRISHLLAVPFVAWSTTEETVRRLAENAMAIFHARMVDLVKDSPRPPYELRVPDIAVLSLLPSGQLPSPPFTPFPGRSRDRREIPGQNRAGIRAAFEGDVMTDPLGLFGLLNHDRRMNGPRRALLVCEELRRDPVLAEAAARRDAGFSTARKVLEGMLYDEMGTSVDRVVDFHI